jgi:hypothetical protein
VALTCAVEAVAVDGEQSPYVVVALACRDVMKVGRTAAEGNMPFRWYLSGCTNYPVCPFLTLTRTGEQNLGSSTIRRKVCVEAVLNGLDELRESRSLAVIDGSIVACATANWPRS